MIIFHRIIIYGKGKIVKIMMKIIIKAGILFEERFFKEGNMTQLYIQLNDKMKIPQIGFGVWKIADEDAPNTIECALDCGYRSIDTAAIYGNEVGVGKGIIQSSLRREEIFLTTKIWNQDQGYDATLRAMDVSLKKLATSYVDLYLIHWPAPKMDKYVPTWKALGRLRTEGLARSIGVSNFTIDHLKRLMDETGIIPAINQIELHPYFQQKELREFHEKHNIATEAWSPLARSSVFEEEIIIELAKKYNKTPSQIVLRWHIENNIIAIPKSGISKRILENFNVFDFILTSDDIAKIDKLDSSTGRSGPDPLTADF